MSFTGNFPTRRVKKLGRVESQREIENRPPQRLFTNTEVEERLKQAIERASKRLANEAMLTPEQLQKSKETEAHKLLAIARFDIAAMDKADQDAGLSTPQEAGKIVMAAMEALMCGLVQKCWKSVAEAYVLLEQEIQK